MPANAAVTLDLKANTASASQGIDTLKKQLKTLQDSGTKFAGTFKTQVAFRAAAAAVGQADTLIGALAPEETGNKYMKVARAAASSGAQLAAAFAPLGPVAAAAAGGVGALTGAMTEWTKATKEAEKAAKAEADAKKARGRKHNDAIGEERWQWENADDAGRGKMQAEARERIRKAKWKVANGMSISDSDVYGVANWDQALALRLVETATEQGGGKVPEGLRVLRDQLRANRFWDIATEEHKASGGRATTKGDIAWRKYNEATFSGDFATGNWIGLGRGFAKSYDDAYAASLEKPVAGGGDAAPAAPNLSALLSGGPSADSLSSIGIGFTGTRRDSQEMLDLLRRIADSSDLTARKEGVAVLGR